MKLLQLITILLAFISTPNFVYASHNHDKETEKHQAHKHDDGNKTKDHQHDKDEKHDDHSDDKHDHKDEDGHKHK